MVYRKHSFMVGISLIFTSLLLGFIGGPAAADDQPYVVSVLDPDQAPFPPDIPLEAHYLNTLTGRPVVVGVHLKDGFTQGTGAFDLLLCYDQSIVSLISVEQGEALAGWEYFTYRIGELGPECSTCPSGRLRMIGIRDTDDGNIPPAGSEHINGFLALLTFRVAKNSDYLNQCARIGFCSIECGDNEISGVNGNQIALPIPDQNDPEGYLLTLGPDYDLNTCLTNLQGEFDPLSYVLFDPGYVCIICMCSRGDINLNGTAHEIGDATLFSNYFIYGSGVWDPIYFENQILASDINDDGQPLTVADLVTLICFITGGDDWNPDCYADSYKLASGDNTAHLFYSMDKELIASIDSPAEIGAAAFIFEHEGLELGSPVLSENIGQMTLGYSDQNGVLRVLVCSLEGRSTAAGEFDLFTVPSTGDGTMELTEVQISDVYGNMMEVVTEKISPPNGFTLWQNYPNPFNATTQIRFALPTASEWRVGIYNIIGQKVEEFSGHAAAGRVAVEWDAGNAPSGMYFYRLTAGDFTNTRKMVLMK
ncbi:T9SS type A sorting domain-containing protein [Candidatus Zixiibacteriota bacterium]